MKYKLALKNKILLLILVIFSACKMHEDVKLKLIVHTEVEINYLVYMAADNNLERFGIKNIKSLQEIGSNDRTNIIVLFDRSPGYDKTENNRTGTDLFYITKNPKKMNDDIIFEYGELDMTSPETLYNFLNTVNHYYPARHTVLNIWSHGRGLYPDGIINRGVIEDYTTGYGAKNVMSIYDFANVLRKYETLTKKYIDIIQFDCCDMQMIEIAYQLRDLTDYMIGSETEIPGQGSNYSAIADFLYNKEFTTTEFSSFLVDSFSNKYHNTLHEYTYSAVDLTKLNSFIVKFNTFCDELIANTPDKIAEIKAVREILLNTDKSYPEFVDLYEFVEKTNALGITKAITKDDFINLIPNCKLSPKYESVFYGVSINFPNTETEQSYYIINSQTNYTELDFYTETKWADFLSVYWSN